MKRGFSTEKKSFFLQGYSLLLMPSKKGKTTIYSVGVNKCSQVVDKLKNKTD